MKSISQIRYRNRWTWFSAAYIGIWVLYFVTNTETWLPAHVLPFVPLEASVPFLPWTAWIYVLVFVMPLATCFFAETDEDVRELLFTYASMALVCTAVFALYPTAYPRPVMPAGAWGWPLSWVRACDTPKNSFPSQHVAMAFLSAFFIHRQRPRWGTAALVLAAAISASTLTTKQHYVLDIAGGLIAACVAFRLCVRPASISERSPGLDATSPAL